MVFKKDDLDFSCEYCGDREGGCPNCGFGEKQKREKIEEEKEIPTPDELEAFFEETKRKLN